MERHLSEVTIKGFKSIKKLSNFRMRRTNILIGANGSGKSNFVDFFKMLRVAMGHEIPDVGTSLDSYMALGGGFDDFLYNGPSHTHEIEARLLAKPDEEIFFSLKRSVDETAVAHGKDGDILPKAMLGAMIGGLLGGRNGAMLGGAAGAMMSQDETTKRRSDLNKHCEGKGLNRIAGIAPYHFHDTRMRSAMRTSELVQDNEYLRLNASNIAPFLLRLREEEPDSYEDIIETIQAVAPFFKDFSLRPIRKGEKERVNLEWYQKDSDYPMQPYHLSDGTLRFICLATALLQPNPPAIIIIDEPELGLHPFALSIFAELLESAAEKSQIIVATQSAVLVDHFTPEDVITVNRVDGASVFKRLDSDDLSVWLEDYSLGDLWQKNVINGGPNHA